MGRKSKRLSHKDWNWTIKRMQPASGQQPWPNGVVLCCVFLRCHKVPPARLTWCAGFSFLSLLYTHIETLVTEEKWWVVSVKLTSLFLPIRLYITFESRFTFLCRRGFVLGPFCQQKLAACFTIQLILITYRDYFSFFFKKRHLYNTYGVDVCVFDFLLCN